MMSHLFHSFLLHCREPAAADCIFYFRCLSIPEKWNLVDCLTVRQLIRLPSSRQHQAFHTTALANTSYKLKNNIQDCYLLLGVEDNCSNDELKASYLEKAKAYHPDSGSITADTKQFIQIKDAYKSVLEHRKGRQLDEEEENEAETIFDIKHTAPQHRQYLEFEGVGFGTPSQRQNQYQQYRVARVAENIFQHRIQKLAREVEDALVVKNKQQAKKNVISNAIERLVEDLIQESMKRGEFDNLPGQGRPLEHSVHNPFVDVTTHNINKILVNNGFAPEWIMLSSEIRKEMQRARGEIAILHKRHGSGPLSGSDAKIWKATLDKFRQNISEVNAKIHKFNLIVPFLDKQKMPYTAERELNRIMENVDKFILQDWESQQNSVNSASSVSEKSVQSSTDWKMVWKDIKEVFKS